MQAILEYLTKLRMETSNTEKVATLLWNGWKIFLFLLVVVPISAVPYIILEDMRNSDEWDGVYRSDWPFVLAALWVLFIAFRFRRILPWFKKKNKS